MTPCKTCRWAEWERTKNGRANIHRSGQCVYVVPFTVPAIPRQMYSMRNAADAMASALKSSATIWWEAGEDKHAEECPTWTKAEGR